MRLERGGGRERGREREGGGTREVVGKGKAETGRDREGEGDVVLPVAAGTYGSVDGSACGCFEGLDCGWMVQLWLA